MSNLETKFEALETQLAAQNTAIVNALDSILTAMGAPPPTATVTLGDTVAVMNALNNNLIGMAIANGSFYAAVIDALATTNTLLSAIHGDMDDKLDAIFNTIDTMNNNASLNAQRLLTAFLQSACPCDDTIPLLPLPLDVTPTIAAENEKCQRVQYFLDLFATVVSTTGAYVGNQGTISSFQLNNLLQLALLDVSISTGTLRDGMPTSVRDALVSKILSAVASGGAAAFDSALFNTVTNVDNLGAMRQALYAFDNAAEGKVGFSAAIDAISVSEPYATIIKDMFYSAWPNDIYSDVPIIDASAYDGELCSPPVEGCHEYEAASIGDGYLPVIWGTPFSEPHYNVGDFIGYRLTLTALSGEAPQVAASLPGAVQLYVFSGVGDSYDVVVNTEALGVFSQHENATTSFTIELCEPGAF